MTYPCHTTNIIYKFCMWILIPMALMIFLMKSTYFWKIEHSIQESKEYIFEKQYYLPYQFMWVHIFRSEINKYLKSLIFLPSLTKKNTFYSLKKSFCRIFFLICIHAALMCLNIILKFHIDNNIGFWKTNDFKLLIGNSKMFFWLYGPK